MNGGDSGAFWAFMGTLAYLWILARGRKRFGQPWKPKRRRTRQGV